MMTDRINNKSRIYLVSIILTILFLLYFTGYLDKILLSDIVDNHNKTIGFDTLHKVYNNEQLYILNSNDIIVLNSDVRLNTSKNTNLKHTITDQIHYISYETNNLVVHIGKIYTTKPSDYISKATEAVKNKIGNSFELLDCEYCSINNAVYYKIPLDDNNSGDFYYYAFGDHALSILIIKKNAMNEKKYLRSIDSIISGVFKVN